MKGRISEIFESLQGEGLYFGEKQVFVRFFDCNLNCAFCDTKLDYYRGYEPLELFAKIRSFSDTIHSVVFTGGEPLAQDDFLKEILLLTSAHGYTNYLETNGTLPVALSRVIDQVDIIAMDFKLPSSIGYGNDFWREHREFLKIASQKQVFIKAVICHSTTLDDLNECFSIIRDTNKGAVVVLQPNSNEEGLALERKINSFRQICVKNNVAVCIVPQLHKMLGVR